MAHVVFLLDSQCFLLHIRFYFLKRLLADAMRDTSVPITQPEKDLIRAFIAYVCTANDRSGVPSWLFAFQDEVLDHVMHQSSMMRVICMDFSESPRNSTYSRRAACILVAAATVLTTEEIVDVEYSKWVTCRARDVVPSIKLLEAVKTFANATWVQQRRVISDQVYCALRRGTLVGLLPQGKMHVRFECGSHDRKVLCSEACGRPLPAIEGELRVWCVAQSVVHANKDQYDVTFADAWDSHLGGAQIKPLIGIQQLQTDLLWAYQLPLFQYGVTFPRGSCLDCHINPTVLQIDKDGKLTKSAPSIKRLQVACACAIVGAQIVHIAIRILVSANQLVTQRKGDTRDTPLDDMMEWLRTPIAEQCTSKHVFLHIEQAEEQMRYIAKLSNTAIVSAVLKLVKRYLQDFDPPPCALPAVRLVENAIQSRLVAHARNLRKRLKRPDCKHIKSIMHHLSSFAFLWGVYTAAKDGSPLPAPKCIDILWDDSHVCVL
jgi:hypothetical protein